MHSPPASRPPAVPVPPPPLRLARWLIIVFLAQLALVITVGFGAELVFAVLGHRIDPTAPATLVIGLALALLSLLQAGLWLASFVMSIIVIVTARAELRVAAIVTLVSLLATSVVTIEISGDTGSIGDPGQQVVSALLILGHVYRAMMVVFSGVAAFLLLRGYRIAARDSLGHGLRTGRATGLPGPGPAGGTGLPGSGPWREEP